METAKVELRNVGMRYGSDDSAVVALRGVDFSVMNGEFISVVGPSGCGKSTLLRLICHLLAPTAGEVLVDGTVVSATPPSVGLMFQGDTLLPWSSVSDNVRLGLKMRGVKRSERQETVDELLASVDLQGFGDRYPHELSGGMRKRVSLAQVLAYDPDVLLMDEPFGALDFQTKVRIESLFLNIWQRLQKSVIFITHDIEEAIALSDRLLVMTPRPGRVKEEYEIDLPRPRDFYEIRFDDRFKSLQRKVWTSLQESER